MLAAQDLFSGASKEGPSGSLDSPWPCALGPAHRSGETTKDEAGRRFPQSHPPTVKEQRGRLIGTPAGWGAKENSRNGIHDGSDLNGVRTSGKGLLERARILTECVSEVLMGRWQFSSRGTRPAPGIRKYRRVTISS